MLKRTLKKFYNRQNFDFEKTRTYLCLYHASKIIWTHFWTNCEERLQQIWNVAICLRGMWETSFDIIYGFGHLQALGCLPTKSMLVTTNLWSINWSTTCGSSFACTIVFSVQGASTFIHGTWLRPPVSGSLKNYLLLVWRNPGHQRPCPPIEEG